MSSETILCVGYARLPEGMTGEVLYKVFGVGLEIDPSSGIIVRAETTSVTKMGNDFVTKFFVNKNIETNFREILEQIVKHYRGHGGKAILAATKKAYAEYLGYKGEYNLKPRLDSTPPPRSKESFRVCR